MPPPDGFSWLHATFCDWDVGFFCIVYFLTFLHKVYMWQDSMTSHYWAMTLFSRSCHGPFYSNTQFCGSFQLFFDIHEKSNYPWQFKCIRQWVKCNCWPVTPVQVIWRHHIWCHRRSWKHLMSVTLHRIDVEPWARCHCIFLVKMHELIYSTTWAIYQVRPNQVRSFGLTLGQIFKLTFRCLDAYDSMRLDERNKMAFRFFLYLS